MGDDDAKEDAEDEALPDSGLVDGLLVVLDYVLSQVVSIIHFLLRPGFAFYVLLGCRHVSDLVLALVS